MGKEAPIEAHSKKISGRRGYLCLKLGLISGGGWPDHTILAPGPRIGFIEFKAPGATFRPLQKMWLNKLKQFGFPAEVCYSKEQVDDFYEVNFGKQ